MSLQLLGKGHASQENGLIEVAVAECLARRKRKIEELYAVTCDVSPVPAVHSIATHREQNKDLLRFLDQNDLSLGRYFQESTLPRRPNYASTLPSTRPTTKVPPTELAFSNHASTDTVLTNDSKVLPKPSTSGREDLSAPNGHLDAKQIRSNKQYLDKEDIRNNEPAYQFTAGHDPSRSSLTGPTTPRPTAQRLSSSTLGKPNVPASPPYSPGRQDPRSNIFQDAQSVAPRPEEPVNILTPAGDSNDGLPTSPSASMADDFATKPRPVSPVRGTPPADQQKEDDPLEAHAAVAAPKTANGEHSSSLGKNAQDQAALNGMNDLGKIEAQIDSAHAEGSGKANAPLDGLETEAEVVGTHMQATGAIAGPGSPTLRPSEIAKVSENNLRTDTDGLIGRTEQMPDTNAAQTGPEKLQMESFIKNATNTQDRRSRSPTPMDVDKDMPQASPAQRAIVKSATTKKATQRIRKPKRSGKRRSLITLANAKDEQHFEAARSLRKNQGFPEYGSLGFFKPLYKRMVLQNMGSKSTSDLLNNTTKSINTSDYLVNIREENDMRVLDRVRRLQSLEGRWSYKSPAPAKEPEPKLCHWDLLMKDVKWLRTDFREERKLKMAVARDLADWCAEWVNGDEATRQSLQVRLKRKPTSKMPGIVQDSFADEDDVPSLLAEDGEISSDEDSFDPLTDVDRPATKRIRLDETLFHSIPEYGVKAPYKDSMHTLRAVASADVDLEDPHLSTTISNEKAVDGLLSTILSKSKEPELDPEEVTCALFNPESRPLRARLNAPWAFKPPSVPMPPQAFFEHRNASQWTWEDDQMLKQYAKDFPSNWTLIADRLAPRSLFNSYVDRRTPWECYERLLGMEGPPADAQAKQYLRHFHTRIERAKESFEAHQATIREHAEQQARNAGQPVPNMQPKRFPAPLRVDRKPNKRLLAILDGARKMAKKRENQAVKQQQQAAAQQETQQQQRPVQPQGRATQTPQYWSKLKYERELREQERVQQMRQHQRAMMEATRQAAASGQPMPTATAIAQQMRSGGSGTLQVPGTGLTGIPNLPNAPNPVQRQAMQQMAISGNMPAISAQIAALNNRNAQAQLAGNQQRLAPQMNGTSTANAQDSMRIAQQLQQQRMQQMGQQQLQSGQMPRRSPNTNVGMNGVSNIMMNQFNNAMRSPGVQQQQQQQNGNVPRASPNVSQASMNTGNAQPPSLSSGHVPAIVNLQHQIRANNPALTQQEASRYATEQFKQLMNQVGRQSAMTSATGTNGMNNNVGGNNNNNNSTPFTQQQIIQQQLQNNSMYNQANNMIATPQQRAAVQAQAAQNRNAGSPPNTSANLAGTPQQAQAQLNGQGMQQQPGQANYAAQLRQQMLNQSRLNASNNPQAAAAAAAATQQQQGIHRSPNNPHVSPAMAMSMPASTPNNTAGFQRPQGPTTPSGMPSQAGSMRPPSRTPSSMSINNAAHLSPQQQMAQMQQMQRSISGAGSNTGMGTPTPQMMQRVISGQGQGQNQGMGMGQMHLSPQQQQQMLAQQMQMSRSASGAGSGGNVSGMGMMGGTPTPQMLQAQLYGGGGGGGQQGQGGGS